jgi:hypothetical protein
MSEILCQRDNARQNAVYFREEGTFNFISINTEALERVEQ